MRIVVEFLILNFLAAPIDALLPNLDLAQIFTALNGTCVVLVVEKSEKYEYDYSDLLIALRGRAFGDGAAVFGRVQYDDLVSDPYVSIKTEPLLRVEPTKSAIVVFERKRPDRSCLLATDLIHKTLKGGFYDGRPDPGLVLAFINEFCGTFRTLDGDEDDEGKRRKSILKNLYSVEKRIDMKMILDRCGDEGNLKEFFYTGRCKGGEMRMELPKCDTIDGANLTKAAFFENYVSRSKPVILKKFLPAVWPNFPDWTNEFFRQRFGDRRVHIKLTPSGEFEGVEEAALWSNCVEDVDRQFCTSPFVDVPEAVQKHLTFSRNLVMVRPASAQLTMTGFIDLIENRTRLQQYNGSLSAYLEYTPVWDTFVDFNGELPEMPFVKKLLKLDSLNMWLSNGNTLGKLHFDQYDNFLCQVSGKKRLILFEPHNNTQLYEGHIVEAELAFVDGRFVRLGLMESTALTMSPVDIEKPNFERFAQFAHAVPLNCTIEPGDVLFMPSFWWHEVQSYPDPDAKRNLAFNFWYEPFLSKEFPCVDCKLDVNPSYRHLLSYH